MLGVEWVDMGGVVVGWNEEAIGLGLRLKVCKPFGGVIWEGIRVGVGDWDG